jgi:hypothetical protein
MGRGGELLPEVTEADFDGAEELAVGSVGEGVGHLVDQRESLSEELLAQALAPLVAGFFYFRDRRRGWMERG